MSWVILSLLVCVTIAAVWVEWWASDLDRRVIRDILLFAIVSGAVAFAYGRDSGWRVDRRAVRNTVDFAAFVLRFSLVGSSLPTIAATSRYEDSTPPRRPRSSSASRSNSSS